MVIDMGEGVPTEEFARLIIRGGVEDTRLEAKAKDTKNSRPRTTPPRTDPFQAILDCFETFYVKQT